ncbi:tyrosine-type recombinase/integrase [Nocardioides aequoreus]|uniref:tyrosine-type recombinase/integrase n=1 Tax=Nocardioides aequoreus TaxID=397278 RepID=UPI0004C3A1B9|nr:site-specific integrase [Nocardioides aequoreus]
MAELVLGHWAQQGDFTPATLEKCGETVARFTRRLDRQGVVAVSEISAEHCAGFIDALTRDATTPSLTTRHSRRSAIRMFFRTLRELGYEVGDPSLDVRLPSRTNAAARPLSEVEVTLCRASSRLGEAGGRSLHRAVCWALGETTAVSSEISAVRVGDVDHPGQPRWVRLPGTRRHDPRLGELSDWGSRIVARQLELLAQRGATPATLLSYRGQQVGGGTHAQSAVCNALGGVLTLSGLAAEPDVRPASVRNTAGRRLYEAGLPIEQVARRMGARSLDTVAADIALEWRASP